MDPITTFTEALENEIEFPYVGDSKVDITEKLLDAGYAVVSPGLVTLYLIMIFNLILLFEKLLLNVHYGPSISQPTYGN